LILCAACGMVARLERPERALARRLEDERQGD
jgi:hypothetical protein